MPRACYMTVGHLPPVRMRRMIERGQLRHYWLPGREAKQRSYLVRRSEVEQVQQHQDEE